MQRVAVAVLVGLLSVSVAHADVRTEEKTLVKFEGMLGRMMNMFGGRAAREGVVSTVTVKGDRKMTLTGDTAQIIDLAEEKIYDLDMRDKTYTVTTFAELRRKMEEAREKASSQAPPEAGREQSGEPQKEMEVDFKIEESGQKRAINGFDAREVVMTVAVREKGKTLEESGGFVMASHSWLAPTIGGVSEVAAFDRRYAEQIAGSAMLDAQQMAMALAMYPMMQQAMAKFQAEQVNMEGTPVMTTVTFEAVASQAQAQEASEQKESSGGGFGLGGLGGRLGRRIMRRGGDDQPAAAGAGTRSTVMTMQHELMKVSPAVADADVAIPAGFKLKS